MGHWGKAKKTLWEGNVFGIYWLQLDFKGYPKSPGTFKRTSGTFKSTSANNSLQCGRGIERRVQRGWRLFLTFQKRTRADLVLFRYDTGPPRRGTPFGDQHSYVCKREVEGESIVLGHRPNNPKLNVR